MNDFVASNGIKIRVDDGPSGAHLLGFMPTLDQTHATGSGEGIQALREFFQAEADERLSRWRDPQQPRFVVYGPFDAVEIGRDLTVIDEVTGAEYSYRRSEDDGHAHGNQAFEHPWSNKAAWAARHYFDAHPELKPWHEANPGEVWLLAHNGAEVLVEAGKASNGLVYWPITGRPGSTPQLSPTDFSAGRRIFPEVS